MNENQKNNIENTKYYNGILIAVIKKINKLKILVSGHFPDLIYLQEINFTDQTYRTLWNFTNYNKNRTNVWRASEGVAIFVKIVFPSNQINLITHL